MDDVLVTMMILIAADDKSYFNKQNWQSIVVARVGADKRSCEFALGSSLPFL